MTVPSGGFQAGSALDSRHSSSTSSSSTSTNSLYSTSSGRARHVKFSLATVAASAAAAEGGGEDAVPSPGRITPRTDLPTLFNFPESVHPAYRPLPTAIRLGLAVLSALLAAASTYTKMARHILGGGGSSSAIIDHMDWRRTVGLFAKFALRALLIGTIATTAIQEAFLRPSRIDSATLLEKGWLPSTLSRFDSIQTRCSSIPSLGNTNTDLEIRVHYLRYAGADNNASSKRKLRFDVLHCNHGFGASSLSWLPALPALASRIGARVALAHDAVGFGFTDRPKASSGRKKDLIPYSLAGSAAIGAKLITNELENDEPVEREGTEQKSVALFGHSMGCTTTLRMALELPRNTRKFIVLVAPALMLPSKTVNANTAASKGTPMHPRGRVRSFVDRLLAAGRQIFVDAPFGYFLRRVVGKPNFWITSLQSVVWGNPSDVSDADGLRFQWPAIGRGWETGLLAFTRSRLFNIDAYAGGDAALLSDVLDLPDIKVIVVAGGSDKIIPPRASRGIAERFFLRFVPLPGRGHDPFEENPEEFVNLVETLLEEQDPPIEEQDVGV